MCCKAPIVFSLSVRSRARGGPRPSRVATSSLGRLLGLAICTDAAAELKDFVSNPLSNCSAAPQGEDLFKWNATIIGPDGSPYAGGVFFMEVHFPPVSVVRGCHRPFLLIR